MTPPGVSAPPYRRGTAGRLRQVLLAVVVAVALGVAALMVLAVLGSELGTGGLAVGAVLALLPLVPVSLCFVWLDRWEPEPPAYLLLALAWGAVVAAGVALVLNSLAVGVLAPELGQEQAGETVAVVVAPVVEEAAKGAFLVAFLVFRRHEFDGVVDGIVLGGLAGVGFAFTENILYFGRAFVDGIEGSGLAGGVTASIGTFVARGILSPFAHPLFTVMTGIGIGVAVTTRRAWLKPLAVVGGFGLAVVLHALWNSAAVSGGGAFLSLYATVMVPVFLAAVALATWSRRREGSVVRRQLPAYAAAGWIAPYEVAVLSDLPTRRRLVQEADRRAGPDGARATREYHSAATELAFLRERLLHGTAVGDAPAREADLLAVLADRRRRALVPGPGVQLTR